MTAYKHRKKGNQGPSLHHQMVFCKPQPTLILNTMSLTMQVWPLWALHVTAHPRASKVSKLHHLCRGPGPSHSSAGVNHQTKSSVLLQTLKFKTPASYPLAAVSSLHCPAPTCGVHLVSLSNKSLILL